MSSTVGVDVGGTFTDAVVLDGPRISGWKVPTTVDQAIGVAKAMDDANVDADVVFLHGTTAGTNALLEERGALCALVTSEGFEDVIEIGRQARPSLYDPFADRPPALVPRHLRIGYAGDLDEVVRRLDGAEAVAVALVRSYADPTEERELAARLADVIEAPISVAATVSPAFREYERVATTVLNAYLTPEVAGYLRRLDASVAAGRRLAMTSSGGLLPFEIAAELAGRLVLSGPAAGVVAARAVGAAKGHRSVISFDMGGTSTDVCRIDGVGHSRGFRAGAGRVNRVPSLPVHTIGAGGGSVAWVDEGGALRVGPRSAGAHPGPAAYGLGGLEPTVTDANVVMGRIPVDLALAGTVSLDLEAARRALARVGDRLSLSPEAVAAGIIDVVDSHMERALRAVSVEEGADPRDSTLVAYGGAGGLHASRLGKRLGIDTILIPPLSGVFSALGLLLASPSSDAERTVMIDEGSERITTETAEILAAAQGRFASDHGTDPIESEASADVRYVGQSHELEVPLVPDWQRLRGRFEDLHRAQFGFHRPTEPIELVNVRAVARGNPPITWGDLPSITGSGVPSPRQTEARVGGAEEVVPVWRRETLPSGWEATGAGVVVERDAAVWLEPGDRMVVEEDGTLRISW